MKAAVLKNIQNIDIEDYSIRKLNSNEVLIHVTNCGICGTDKHIFEGTAPSAKSVILGHEYSGIIVDNNNNLQFKPGDKVVVDPNIICGTCTFCKKGKINFCTHLKALGVTLNGGFAEYSIVPTSQLYTLPNEFDLSTAAFAEPLSCCLHGINQLNNILGENAVVIGGGSIGLLFIQLAKLAGASNVFLIEPVEFKRNLGLQLGADYVFNPKAEHFLENFYDATKKDVGVIIECVGSKETVELSINLAGKGTKIVIFGLAPKNHDVQLNLQKLFQNEIKIFNSLLNPNTFQQAVHLLVNNKIKVDKLVNEFISLNQLQNVLGNFSNSRIIKYQYKNNIKEAV